jgi:protein phosphatase
MIEKQMHELETRPYRVRPTNKSIITTTELQLDVAAISDIGQRRSNNEDSYGYDLETNLFVVCDGMGGLSAGEVASKTAVEYTLRTYRQLFNISMDPAERLDGAISSANQEIWDRSRQDPQFRGMGTTLVAASLLGARLLIANVGDSRAYFLRDGHCIQITEDHSYVAEQVRRGVTSEISARLRQVITRAVGVEAAVEPDFFVGDLESEDIVLLTTDGLTRYADAEMLTQQIYAHSDLDDACRSLIAIAHGGGAEDNVTCLLLRVR